MPQTAPSREEVFKAELERVLAHPAFPKRGALPLILSFLVNKCLSGDADQIKGYTILVDALGRGGQVDAQSEASLRVQMKRLRDALANVYRDSSGDHPVRIDFHAGSYVPVLMRVPGDGGQRQPASSASGPIAVANGAGRSRWRFAMMILAVGVCGFFVGLATDYVVWHKPKAEAHPFDPVPSIAWRPDLKITVTGFGEEGQSAQQNLVFALSRSELFKVSQVARGREGNASAAGRPAFEMTIANRGPDQPPLAQIQNIRTGEMVYSAGLKAPRPEPGEMEQLAWLLMSTNSPIMAYLTKYPSSSLGSYECVLRTTTYFQTYQDKDFEAMRACIEAFRDQTTPDTLMEAVIGWYHMARFWRRENPEEALLEAWNRATRAAEIAPMSARAHYLKSIVLSAQGDFENALQVGRLAHALNPLDETATSGLGVRLLGTGKWQEANSVLRSVYRRVPSPPVWLTFNLATAEIMAGEMTVLTEVFPQLLATRSHVAAAIGLATANLLGDPTRTAMAQKRLASFGTVDDAVKAIQHYYKNKDIVERLIGLIRQ